MGRIFNRHKRAAYRIARDIWLREDGLNRDIEDLRMSAEDEVRRIVNIDVMTVLIIIELIIKIWQIWKDMQDDNPPQTPPFNFAGLNYDDPQDEECCGDYNSCQEDCPGGPDDAC